MARQRSGTRRALLRGLLLAACALAAALPAQADQHRNRGQRFEGRIQLAGNDTRERQRPERRQRQDGKEQGKRGQQLQMRQQEFRSLPPDQQNRVRNAARQYRSLPPEQRQQLRQRYEQLSPEDRERIRRKTEERRRGREG